MLYYVKRFALHLCAQLIKKDFAMFEKNLELGYLLDFYGELLSPHRREAMNYYYNDDMSLAEIASCSELPVRVCVILLRRRGTS